MNADRKKLIDWIRNTYISNSKCAYKATVNDTADVVIADYLIANGVKIQQWIPVAERLPKKNTAVIAATDNGIVFQCLYAYDGWDLWEGNEVNITHWMPMPEPPKEKA